MAKISPMAKAFSPPTEVIRQAEGHDELVVQAAELRVTSGPDKGRRCKLERGRVVVGSARECHLVLDDPAISRRQFELEATSSGFLLRDLDSTNGTFVGGVRLFEALLPEGAVIEVGRDKLRLVASKERDRFLLSSKERFGRLFGKSPAMRHCFALLERAADAETTVLVEGESGTGKELVTASLHERSRRAGGPLVVADCGAISPTLIESELFGQARVVLLCQGVEVVRQDIVSLLAPDGVGQLELEAIALHALGTAAARGEGEVTAKAEEMLIGE